jgi:hypothetical protein
MTTRVAKIANPTSARPKLRRLWKGQRTSNQSPTKNEAPPMTIKHCCHHVGIGVACWLASASRNPRYPINMAIKINQIQSARLRTGDEFLFSFIMIFAAVKPRCGTVQNLQPHHESVVGQASCLLVSGRLEACSTSKRFHGLEVRIFWAHTEMTSARSVRGFGEKSFGRSASRGAE